MALAVATGNPMSREHNHRGLREARATPWVRLTSIASILDATFLPDLVFLPSFFVWPSFFICYLISSSISPIKPFLD